MDVKGRKTRPLNLLVNAQITCVSMQLDQQILAFSYCQFKGDKDFVFLLSLKTICSRIKV
jgi:hypothetical protein